MYLIKDVSKRIWIYIYIYIYIIVLGKFTDIRASGLSECIIYIYIYIYIYSSIIWVIKSRHGRYQAPKWSFQFALSKGRPFGQCLNNLSGQASRGWNTIIHSERPEAQMSVKLDKMMQSKFRHICSTDIRLSCPAFLK